MEEASSVGVKEFSANILGHTVHFHVISLQQSLFLWAGTKLSFKSLAVAMQTKYEKHPTSLQLLGDATNPSSSNLAKQIAKKTGCQCFISINVDASFYSAIEEHIMELINREPRTFFFQ